MLCQLFKSNFSNTELLNNELLSSIAPSTLVSWLSSTAEVSRDLSNISEAHLFCTLCSDFLNYSDDGPQDKLVKANYFGVQGLVCSDLGQYNQAKEYQEKSLVFQKEIYGEHHGDVAKSYNNLGIVYGKIAQYNLAKEYHEKSQKIIENRFMVNTMVR